MYTRRQLAIHTHTECVHFNNGFCTLNNIPVNPDQSACLRFTPKNMTVTSASNPYIQPPQIAQLYSQPNRTLNIRGYLQTLTFQLRPPIYTVSNRGAGSGGGRGRRGGMGRIEGKGGFAAVPGGSCVCPKCSYTTPHTLGLPCYQQTCAKCGTPMTRQR